MRRWSSKEIEILEEYFPNHSNRELSEILGRTVSAINSKGSKLGLKKNPKTLFKIRSHQNIPYLEELNEMNPDEVDISEAYKHKEWLKRMYYDKEYSLYDIAEMTGTTRKNVEYWMNKYNLPRRQGIEKYTMRSLKKISETGKGRVPFSKGLTKYDHPSIMKISEKMSGDKSPHWKGGTTVNDGYILTVCKDHPKADKDGYVLEHRLVMEEKLGRYLTDEEIVHHRDENRANNDISNLFLFPNNSSHLSFHNYKKHHDPDISEEEFMRSVYLND